MILTFSVRASGIYVFVETPFETIFRGVYESWEDVFNEMSNSSMLQHGLWKVCGDTY